MDLTWCEISQSALHHNVRTLRQIVGEQTLLAPTVKGNAYGHGLLETSRIFLHAGADWLCVNALYEARTLRQAGIKAPLYMVGYVALSHVREALALDCQLVCYNRETLEAASRAARELGKPAALHLKVETGNNRQGLPPVQALAMARDIHHNPWTSLAGVASHYANVEDTTDHNYAQLQFARFEAFCSQLTQASIPTGLRHISNSAATLLWPDRTLELVRTGIATYGMWPSKETLVAALLTGRQRVELKPALRWCTRIVQIKEVPAGEYIGYGCTYRTTHPIRLALLPVGYYDGYDRKLSNIAHVLVCGKRAPVRGRVCMNIIMVDVTDIPQAHLEGTVTLLGRDQEEVISAEQFADWAGTINYEATTRINDRIPRTFVT